MAIATEQNTEQKELSDYKKRQIEIEELKREKVVLTDKVKDLWEKSQELISENKAKDLRMAELKNRLEKSNENARIDLAKKNAEIDQLKSIKPQNEGILKENGALSAQLDVVKNDLLMSNQRYEALKSIEAGLNSEISELRIAIHDLKDIKRHRDELLFELNSLKKDYADIFEKFKAVQANVVNLTKDLNIFKNDNAVLKSENKILKASVGAKNGKMYAFKTVVIFLAVLANFLLLGKKFMALTGEKDWQTYIISYGSVIIFDLTVIFLTMVNRSKEALYFGIGVFVLTFFQIGKPFEAIKQYFGTDLYYLEVVISGCIYSFFFAFLSYFLSKIKTES